MPIRRSLRSSRSPERDRPRTLRKKQDGEWSKERNQQADQRPVEDGKSGYLPEESGDSDRPPRRRKATIRSCNRRNGRLGGKAGDGGNQSASPLAKEIRDYISTMKTCPPRISRYYGRSDPIGHLARYEKAMRGVGHGEMTMCRMFGTYLGGKARGWYRALKPNSITSYDQLRSGFLDYFEDNRLNLPRAKAGPAMGPPTTSLVTIRQAPEEDIGSYLERFKSQCDKIEPLREEMAMGFLYGNLHPEKGKELIESISESWPTTLEEMYARADRAGGAKRGKATRMEKGEAEGTRT